MNTEALVLSPPRRWLSDFWDIRGAPGGDARCLYTHFCWCLAAGDVADKVGGSYALDCGVGFFGMYWCIYWIPFGLTRTRLRTAHGIEGSLMEDFLATACCPCCYLSQALNHLELVELPPPLLSSLRFLCHRRRRRCS
jgi:Cys-rich protein (TIGR01571 family)